MKLYTVAHDEESARLLARSGFLESLPSAMETIARRVRLGILTEKIYEVDVRISVLSLKEQAVLTGDIPESHEQPNDGEIT